jgi:hypothetical protein
LLERDKSAKIHAGSGFIWRIPDDSKDQRRCTNGRLHRQWTTAPSQCRARHAAVAKLNLSFWNKTSDFRESLYTYHGLILAALLVRTWLYRSHSESAILPTGGKCHHRLDRARAARDRGAGFISVEHRQRLSAAQANISETIWA